MKIVICDDEQSSLSDLKQLLGKYEAQCPQELAVSSFRCPFDLLETVESGRLFDIFLLDICMAGMTGIALAQALRLRGVTAPVIFLTASKDYALEAFGVGATQYLLKPFQQTDFFAAMDAAVGKSCAERRRQVMFKTEAGFKTVAVRDILYAECRDKNQEIALTDGTCISVRITSSELFDLLSPYSDFARCGAAYILNLAHIHALGVKAVVMKNGVSIKIPRGAYPKLKSDFFQFFYERQV